MWSNNIIKSRKTGDTLKVILEGMRKRMEDLKIQKLFIRFPKVLIQSFTDKCISVRSQAAYRL